MGEVCLAAHARLARRDAVKNLPAALIDNASFSKRFCRDAKTANILLTTASSPRRILLSDFGNGREIATAGGLTATNTTVDTLD